MQKFYNNKHFDYIYKYSWIELVEKFNKQIADDIQNKLELKRIAVAPF